VLYRVPVLLIQQIQRLAIKHQILIVDTIRQFPGLRVQVDFSFLLGRGGGGGGVGGSADAGDEVVLFV
jgi:hypothetical protein